MSVKFNDEHKKETSMSEYIPEGVHKVKIGFVDTDETQDGRPFLQVDVLDDEEREGSVRFWFHTDKAINYSFNILRGIFVHNAPADKKDKIRAQVDNLKDLDELNKACQMLIGKEAWYSNFQNPNRTYQDSQGNTKNSYDRNLYGYEPKAPTPETVTADDLVSEPTKKAESSDDNDQIIADF